MARREIRNPAEGLFNTGEFHQEASPEQVYEAESLSPAQKHLLVTAPPLKESRTRRKQFVLTPSLSAKAEAKCKVLGISLNEAVNQLLEKWVNG
jgi:predicted HicB family RNase H-like nuclease